MAQKGFKQFNHKKEKRARGRMGIGLKNDGSGRDCQKTSA
jgi:hypothetical protein